MWALDCGCHLILQPLLFRAEFTKKKNGVNIVSEYDLQNGRIHFPVTPNERKTITLTIKNSGINEVTLHGYKKLRRSRELTFKATPSPPVRLPPGNLYICTACFLCYMGKISHYNVKYPIIVLLLNYKYTDMLQLSTALTMAPNGYSNSPSVFKKGTQALLSQRKKFHWCRCDWFLYFLL